MKHDSAIGAFGRPMGRDGRSYECEEDLFHTALQRRQLPMLESPNSKKRELPPWPLSGLSILLQSLVWACCSVDLGIEGDMLIWLPTRMNIGATSMSGESPSAPID